jgi:signal transduction histidine kinase
MSTPSDQDLFLAVISHELRTPVTVIKGFADTLDQHWESLDPAGRREAVRVVRKRASELARLVDRLLVSTVDPEAFGPFDLVGALREAADWLPPESRQRLRLQLPPTLPRAYGDPASIAPVLTELVTNAAKYSSGEVEVRAAAEPGAVRFEVADRGAGIAPEHVERAFTRYWRADAGDRPAVAGAGLGLHLVRRIVRRQEGWVSLRPRRTGGTVAEVRLLRADDVVTDGSR